MNPRPPLNGWTLIAAFPRETQYMIVAEDETRTHDDRNRFVSAWVPTLDSPTWDSGSYTHALGKAITEAIMRVGYEVETPLILH